MDKSNLEYQEIIDSRLKSILKIDFDKFKVIDKNINWHEVFGRPEGQQPKFLSWFYEKFGRFPIMDVINYEEFFAKPGKEHYKFLLWIASQFSGHDIFDIGTHRGSSALALALGNERNNIYSFDLEHKYELPKLPNIEYFLDDLLTPAGRLRWEKKLLNSAFIFLDIDPHEGTREYEFYLWLKSKNYQGFLICDDIWYFKEMRDNFWYKIPGNEKIDITSLGHWSGTGIVRFEPSPRWPQVLSESPNNWTVVTAYFDLTKTNDASNSIRERNTEHYLKNANSTMSINQNLVVFCEPENLEILKSMRPEWLREKHTKFITMSFEDFPLTKYRQQIQKARDSQPLIFNDDRNTASYYLLCMARYAMLKQVIKENPFGSTHFSWLNICIERMGFSNVRTLESVWRYNREKFSTCFIDYQPEHIVKNFKEYFSKGLCSMCSGFFTGNAEYMTKFCNSIEEKFLDVLNAGYGGHADEQLYPLVYFENPEIFDNYYGDYDKMVVNYIEPIESPFEPIRNFIQSAIKYGNYALAEKACVTIWNGWKKDKLDFEPWQVGYFLILYRDLLQKLGKGNELP